MLLAMESAGQLKHIIIDAENPDVVARFWSRILGQPIERTFGPFTKLQAPAVGPAVTIQAVRVRTATRAMFTSISRLMIWTLQSRM